jgi:hypothetical protein
VPRSLLFILALVSALPASASDIGAVKCAVNQDRVWVYESLNSFDVETRLKCGDTVEILSRVKGYVKIRTASGVEGYVPDSVFPDLPALPPDATDKPIASVVARPVATAIAHATVAPPAVAATAAPAPPSAAPTSVAVVVQPSSKPSPAKVSARSSAAPTTASPVAPSVAPLAPAPAPAPKKAPVSTASARPVAPAAKPASTIASSSPKPASPSNPPAVPTIASIAPVNAKMVDTSANASPSRDISIAQPQPSSSDSEDYPDAKPENESADPACHVFFSAYGLAPAQYKWLVENRRKQYAEICPAPDLASVDYVILFAHDSDTYNSAMPVPVHTDRNGFSDFSPMTTVDTALQSVSDLDKARYEFVWVFHTKRGTFDPTRFSARRRPQFTTDAKGSHASARAVEDAFHFIEGQGSPDR